MARYIAKNLVAAGLADKVEVQLAYAIGVADPVSVYVDTFGTSSVDPEALSKLVREHFPLTPKGIIEALAAPAADLPQDRFVRALRPPAPGVHVGADGQGGRAGRRGRRGRSREGLSYINRT